MYDMEGKLNIRIEETLQQQRAKKLGAPAIEGTLQLEEIGHT